ncbi:chaperone protein DnaJ [Catovirus CTV1]|uniref:Chaperone protein DnaJ n=1 Tax=Catovirus CTV1 TaxID=1977631 RepID=A0A1V0SBQ0_9VIRU|nr:chaperone protein DnaJ [Catovirus CTV1]
MNNQNMSNYYDLLGVSSSSSSKDISDAFKNKVLSTSDEHQLNKIAEAFITLSDNRKKLYYDNTINRIKYKDNIFDRIDKYFNNFPKQSKNFYTQSYQNLTYYNNGLKNSKIIKKVNDNGKRYEKHININGDKKDVRYFYPDTAIEDNKPPIKQ